MARLMLVNMTFPDPRMADRGLSFFLLTVGVGGGKSVSSDFLVWAFVFRHNLRALFVTMKANIDAGGMPWT